MVRPLLISALLVGLPGLANAQSGTVRYDETTLLDFKLPPNSPMIGRLPKTTVKPMQLTFSPEGALWAEAPRAADNGQGRGDVQFISRDGGGGSVMATRAMGGEAMMVMEMRGGFSFGGGGVPDALAGAFTNLSDGSYVEVRQFLGRTFRIPGDRPTFQWKMTGDQATFLGHVVFRATAQKDSTNLEAWFAPDIPVPAGPAQYGGLPGLILTLAVDSNKVVYSATAIDLTTPVTALKAPSDGSKVTRAEYDKIVKEKMDEMAKQRRGRGN